MSHFTLINRDPENDHPRTVRSLRRSAAALGAVAALAVTAAVLIPMQDAHATSPVGLTATSANLTVRQFLEHAVVQDDAYDACQYLTPAEQARVAALAGPTTTCRAALDMQPSLMGLTSADGVGHLTLRATVAHRVAEVTATHPGRLAAHFVLTPTTPADIDPFAAPTVPWRIASGATTLLAPTATSALAAANAG